MMFNNKKGDFMLDILAIILSLVLFFTLQSGLNTLINDVVTSTTDPTVIFMLKSFLFFLLLGIVRFSLNGATNSGGIE